MHVKSHLPFSGLNIFRFPLLGNHILKPERVSMRDHAIQAYKFSLETARSTLLPSIIREAYSNLEDDARCKSGKPLGADGHYHRNDSQASLPKMEDFLNGIFDEGKRTNRKLDARAVAKRMKTAESKNDRRENVARFLPEEWLNYR